MLNYFLVTVSEELRRYNNDSNFSKLRNIVRNIFNPLDIDWDSGWDMYSNISAADYVTEKVKDIETFSSLFKNYNGYCIDLVQRLISLPLKERKNVDIVSSYKLFVNEFSKIEDQISSSYINLYIF